jgi:hypothetical protein
MFWEAHPDQWQRHLPTYRRLFPFDRIDYAKTNILDVGSGPMSVFEALAPADARVIPYDTLAAQYNTLLPQKRFTTVDYLTAGPYGLITLFNCLDHMDRPAELLDRLSSLLDGDGEVWICCHINRPYDAEAHPQDFRFWQLIGITDTTFRLRRCGLARDGVLFPYVWWGVLGRRTQPMSFYDWPRRTAFVSWCALQFAQFHTKRAVIKLVKIIGLRGLLPQPFRF